MNTSVNGQLSQVLQILSAETRSGVGKQSQKAYSMIVCQCVVTDTETGEIKVGELTMPKDAAAPAPGHYTATFKIGIDYRDKKIGGILQGLVPVSTAKPAAPVTSTAASRVS